MAAKGGKVEWVDLKEGDTVKEIDNKESGITEIMVIEDRSKILHPHIKVLDANNKTLANYAVPAGAFVHAKAGQVITAGDPIYKIPRDSGKSRDITGGLPRVAELFEARVPKDSAIIAEVDGIVEFVMRPAKDINGKPVIDREGKPVMEPDIERGNRKIRVVDEHRDEKHDESKDYMIQVSKHLRVHDGDRVSIGDRLCEGALNPHEILRVLGEHAVQKFLIDEIQAVYRLQGVKINDKHIEVIVSQMLSKVRILESGDTEYLQGEEPDKKMVGRENAFAVNAGNAPATFEPVLLGITKASLNTESFLSAASFQETTKVLARAAVWGKTDHLNGLKENLIMGSLIPAGTGIRSYAGLTVKDIEAEVVHVSETDDDLTDFDMLGGEIL